MTLYKFSAIADFKTKQERIYEEVKNAIVNCAFKPGEQIVIRTLAAQMHVSEIPVREALKTLISESFVIEERHNFFVAPISAEEFLSMLDVKLELEKLAIRLTANRVNAEMIAYLRQFTQEMEQEYEEHDIETYKQTHNAFHLALCKLCGVSYLSKAIESAFAHHIRGVTYFNLQSWEHNPSIGEHKAILAALEQNDESAAEQHLVNNRRRATEFYKKQMKEKALV